MATYRMEHSHAELNDVAGNDVNLRQQIESASGERSAAETRIAPGEAPSKGICREAAEAAGNLASELVAGEVQGLERGFAEFFGDGAIHLIVSEDQPLERPLLHNRARQGASQGDRHGDVAQVNQVCPSGRDDGSPTIWHLQVQLLQVREVA